MTIYNIRTTSWPIWILTLLVTLIAGVFLVSATGTKNHLIVIILIFITLFASLYLQQFTSRGQVQISIAGSTIGIKYLTQSIFSKKTDQTILLNNIESYKYQPDKNFDLFKLTLKDQTEIRIWHYTGFAGDDFGKLVLDFPKIVTNYNSHQENTSAVSTAGENKQTGIKREKTLFEGKIGLLLAGFAIFLIIMFIYLMITNKLRGSSGPFGLLASVSGAIFFLNQFFKYRKNEN
jgi:general stress protein CsbA